MSKKLKNKGEKGFLTEMERGPSREKKIFTPFTWNKPQVKPEPVKDMNVKRRLDKQISVSKSKESMVKETKQYMKQFFRKLKD